MGLNWVRESAHSVYLKHAYNVTVADTFLGDDLFGADRSIPIEDKVHSSFKRVQKLSTTFKVAMGQNGRRGSLASKRGGTGRRRGTNFQRGRARV
jgi:hypothetical protein